MIDFEGFGFSGGRRVTGVRLENMHKQITSLLTQARPDLPLFFFAHSMGCLLLENFLNFNKDGALSQDRIAGTIFSAPFFGLAEATGIDAAQKLVIKGLACVADDLVITSGMPAHLVCRNKQYDRQATSNGKSVPFGSLGLYASVFRSHERLNPHQVTYPYLMVLAEYEHVVSNKASKAWHSLTKSKVRQMKLMPGAYHELTKEPNNAFIFEAALKFMGERLADRNVTKPFGEFNHQLVKYYKPRPLQRRYKLIILAALYLFIGVIIAILRRQKNSILAWPRLLVASKK